MSAASAATQTCSNCMFWYYTPMKLSNVSDLLGYCRIRAPSNVDIQPNIVNNWPYTSSKAWCGEWAKK